MAHFSALEDFVLDRVRGQLSPTDGADADADHDGADDDDAPGVD